MSFDLARWLDELPCVELGLGAGQYLFHRGDPVRRMHVVQVGRIQLFRHLEDGAAVVLQRAEAGSMLAEASLFSPRYHCDAIAIIPTRIRAIEKGQMKTRLRSQVDAYESFAAHLAQEIQQTRMRVEILRLRTVSQRLNAWLEWHDGAVPDKGRWSTVAAEIGVSPESLYRELARRRSFRR